MHIIKSKKRCVSILYLFKCLQLGVEKNDFTEMVPLSTRVICFSLEITGLMINIGSAKPFSRKQNNHLRSR